MSYHEYDILIVEDNYNDAELILRALKKMNLDKRAMLIKDGAETLDFIFSRGKYEGKININTLKVIYLDIKLPKVDGLTILKKLKKEQKASKIPVVMFSSSSETKDVEEALKLGANSYVVKPLKFKEFTQTVQKMSDYWVNINRIIE